MNYWAEVLVHWHALSLKFTVLLLLLLWDVLMSQWTRSSSVLLNWRCYDVTNSQCNAVLVLSVANSLRCSLCVHIDQLGMNCWTKVALTGSLSGFYQLHTSLVIRLVLCVFTQARNQGGFLRTPLKPKSHIFAIIW